MKYLFLFLSLFGELLAQTKPAFDTTRCQKFNSSIIIGLFQTYRNLNNNFTQGIYPDSAGVSKDDYFAESKLITGIEVNYDKFSFGLALSSKPQDGSSGKGYTKAVGANFNFGGNKWQLENTYRSFKGFYDRNTAAYDTNFKQTGQYNYQPNYLNTLGRTKFMYFTNHRRYSFKSAYSCNYRQLKSSASWIFSANSHYNLIRNDSSFFAPVSQAFYGDYAKMNRLSVYAISMNAGAAVNIVFWRAFFAHAMFIVGPEQQWRTYSYLDGPNTKLSYLSLSGDLRFSIGLNFKRFYFLIFSRNDFALYNSSFVNLTGRSIGGGYILGWRFNTKTPELYKKFQATKLYSYF